ncbi:hexosaminidase D-like [Fopius arisanus]|uniref:beta-N-acetylhexosaminidase n=1 Tax=Fopius arisanus TaxID=64838 RepID=A0A9R1TIR2_9HYME|nr:PREDICTED: hexosaminidase D-like [Fopius arisanus]
MFGLRGRTLLTLILITALTLLALIYHMLSTCMTAPSTQNPQSHQDSLTSETAAPSYRTQDRQIPRSHSTPLFTGHKIVHLDLKGAPPVLEYYHHLFKLFKTLGATGVLLEYEDMFPYGDSLQNVTATNAYSLQDIDRIQESAGDNNLMVIPLIQTFGHLEFLLKLEYFKDLREVSRYPQVICPTNPQTLPLLQQMIDQIIQHHPGIKYLHIGADEVYHIGECSRCIDEISKHQWTKRQLFLSHVQKITRYIRKNYPHVKILMWDDQFRGISPSEIMETGLHKAVEPVVWKYTRNPAAALDIQWEGYSKIWKSVWVATAFKGATEPDRYWTDISHHLENHQRWLEIMEHWSDRISFKGVILTGWQRYDHFSVLCELLASALPSLAVNLAVLQSKSLNDFFGEAPADVTRALQCDGTVSLTIPEPNYDWTKCRFPGVEVYTVILRLFGINQEIQRMEEENTFKGWLKDYNIRHVFSNPSYVEQAVVDLDRFKMELVYIEGEMKRAMEGVYDEFTFTEWIETFVVPLNEKVTRLWEAKERLLERSSWPRRPLKSEL